MNAPAHYAIGAASALFIQKYLPVESGPETRIIWALMVAIGSHVVADAIPHSGHFLRGFYLVLELIVWTIIMLVLLVGASRTPLLAMIILAGMVGAAIPDGFSVLSRIVGWPILVWVNNGLHFYHGKLPFVYANVWVQLVITVLCSIYVRIKAGAA